VSGLPWEAVARSATQRFGKLFDSAAMTSDLPGGIAACSAPIRPFTGFDHHGGNAGEILPPICYQSHVAKRNRTHGYLP
jgi:hypothetical protein